jgi:hypothetical protein
MGVIPTNDPFSTIVLFKLVVEIQNGVLGECEIDTPLARISRRQHVLNNDELGARVSIYTP